MATKSVFISDISGNELKEEDAVKVAVTDPKSGKTYRLDAARSEVKNLIDVGKETSTPGRKAA